MKSPHFGGSRPRTPRIDIVYLCFFGLLAAFTP
jgi:hypothetical protein